MDFPIGTMHLNGWSNTHAVQAKNAVAELVQHPGYEYLLEAIKLREETLVTALLSESPSDEGARYAERIGELNAVRSFPSLAQGVIEYGQQAETELNDSELQPVA